MILFQRRALKIMYNSTLYEIQGPFDSSHLIEAIRKFKYPTFMDGSIISPSLLNHNEEQLTVKRQ